MQEITLLLVSLLNIKYQLYNMTQFTTVYIDLEAQQNCEEALTNNNMNIVQNVAYIVKPMAIPLSSNVAYESNVHRDTGNQVEYDYT